ncbi:MAG: hypothetical protein IJ300_11480 [Clostridia bacterium]|nr:hypothetical protein [Clostridia bacterium]
MKQIKLIIATLVLAFVLAACGRNDNNDVQTTNEPTATPKQTQGVMDDMGDAVEDVTEGVGNGVKDVGDAVKNTVK